MSIKGAMLGLAAFAMAFTAVVSTAQPAAAVGPCGASYAKVGSYNMMVGNRKGGTLEIYWSSTKKNNCAIAMCYGSTCGRGTYREVGILRTNVDVAYTHEGSWDWATYAGPVYTKNSVGRCISAYARFIGPPNVDDGKASFKGKHCG